ncbi:hypothetical protein DL96DRAFT_1605617 [Flagelloscypha sp. PMI_526]|nr:hypothetical protein DL96DRAFT_1605617 [Flagelloscypha sp. PMI_526]
MRFSVVAVLAAFVATAVAQLPDCATPCIAGADLDGCQATDNACLCKSKAFVNSTTTCITSSCQGDALTQAISVSQELCAKVGVTLSGTSTAPAASGTSSAAAGTTSAAASSASAKPNSASTQGFNAAAGLVALGLAALAL